MSISKIFKEYVDIGDEVEVWEMLQSTISSGEITGKMFKNRK